MTLYVGAARWVGEGKGGLYRRENGQPGWREMDLPQPIQVHAISVHPWRREVVYAATDRGVFRSLDAGNHWQALSTPSLAQTWAIAFHPDDPDRLYAGTSPLGVWCSEDGGETWRAAKVAVPARVRMAFDCRVMRFAFDPTQVNRMYAALEVGGVMRSLDGGASWTDCAQTLVDLAEAHPHLRSRIQSDSDTEGMLDAHAVCVSAVAPERVVLAARMGLFESTDAGTSWRDMAVGQYSPLTYARDIRVSPHDARSMYCCLSPASRSQEGRLYRSDDAGTTWTRIDRGIQPRATMMAVAIDPDDPAGLHCIARGGQVFSSADGGETWAESLLPAEVCDIYAIAHA